MKYIENETKSALHKLKKGRFPFSYDLNIYRGCAHQCQYCYAIYSHQYLETEGDFFNEIFVKTNIAENLDRELSSKRWRGEIINFGGVCDSYQPIERKYRIMRDILKIMIKHRNPIIICTKSDLILRDFDLIEELAEKTYVNIAATITTMDENIKKKIEPFSVSSERRFDVLRKFKKTKASIGLHTMPVIPFITDSRENLEKLFYLGKECGVDYVLNGCLNLVGQTKQHFMNFVKREFPEYYSDYLNLYQDWQTRKEYKENLYKMISQLKLKYGLTGNYSGPIKERLGKGRQATLF